jgi:hypothetical protein
MLGTTAWTMPTRPRTHSPQVRATLDVALHGHRARKV